MGFSRVSGGGESGGRRRTKKVVSGEGELFVVNVIFIGIEAFEVGLRGGGRGGGDDGEVVEEKREERDEGDEVEMSVAASGDEKGEWGRNHHQRLRVGMSLGLRHYRHPEFSF